ncbi:unnamed protein product [Ectocarpus sp. 8 AP-2014]
MAAGRTPLHVAADGGHHRVIRLLLLKGADANGKTSSWCSPLYLLLP